MKLPFAMGPLVIREMSSSDIGPMADNFRDSDRDEVMASHGHTPQESLSYSYGCSSFKATVLYEGQPVACFGVSPDALCESCGSVWLLASKGISKIKPISFLKLSKRLIGMMLNQFPILYNAVDVRNETSIKWLKWCGAIIDEPRSYGKANLPFRFFVFSKEPGHV